MSTVPKITDEHWHAADKATGGYNYVEMCNKAIEIALAEQQESEYITAAQARGKFKDGYLEVLCENGETIKYPAIKPPLQESEYITAAQAQRLGFGKVLVRQKGEKYWQGVTDGFYYSPQFEYRAIKQAQPEPVDKHAELCAEYAKQVKDGTVGFYLWESKHGVEPFSKVTDLMFFHDTQYRCTDISCYVSKDGEPAVRMLRTEAQKLQRKTKDTHDWFFPNNLNMGMHFEPAFKAEGTYTYRTKATIKLDGNMVTPEQAEAEWEAKKKTHDLYYLNIDSVWIMWLCPTVAGFSKVQKYELRPKTIKQPTWTGSRDDVIALLKEVKLL